MRARALHRNRTRHLEAGIRASRSGGADWHKNAELTPEAQKRFIFKSCSAHSDVVHTRFRVNKTDGADEWQWLDDENGWQTIPVDIIHWENGHPRCNV